MICHLSVAVPIRQHAARGVNLEHSSVELAQWTATGGPKKHQAIGTCEPPPFRVGTSVPQKRDTAWVCLAEGMTQSWERKHPPGTMAATGENTVDMAHKRQLL